jgi:hypothetical protein
MNRAALTTTSACALALAAGVAAGSLRSFFPATDRSESPIEAAAFGTPSTDDPLTRAVRTETGAKRWLLLVSAAEKATAKDMPGIIRAAGDDPAAVRMLGAHWAALDAKHMFATLYAEFLLPDGSPAALPQRSTLMDSLFEEWSRADAAGVVKALTDIPNFPALETMRHNVVNRLMTTDVEVALRAMHEWTITNYLPDMKSVAAWAARDPRHAAEVAAKYSRGYAAQEVLKHIGKAWATSDPEGGLRFASTLPTPSRGALAPEILRGWAEKDLDAAASFVAGQNDVNFRNALAQGLVGAWGKKDPAAALEWSQVNLAGDTRNEAIGGIVAAAAEKDLVMAGELVAGMGEGAAQNRAAASLFEVWFKKGGEQRTAAFEWLSALPDKDARRAALDRVQWDWIWRDPQGVRDFIEGPHGELASGSMINQVARNQASKNPAAAMEWISKLPADHRDQARGSVLETWLSIRPDGAMDYVRRLPPGDLRGSAVQRITNTLAWQSPERAAEWIASLPEAEQKTAMNSFGNMDPRQRGKIEQAMKKPAVK